MAGDGQELFYRDGDDMIAVSIEPGQTFLQGNPEVLFEGQYAIPLGGRSDDISPDGERFLMMKDVRDTSARSQIIVVENWFEELKRLFQQRSSSNVRFWPRAVIQELRLRAKVDKTANQYKFDVPRT